MFAKRWAVPILFLGLPAFAADEPAKIELFERDRIWSMHLKLSAKDWDAMQPSGGRMGFGPGAGPGPGRPPQPAPNPEQTQDSKTSAFGMNFPYVHGTVEFEGKTYKDVGIRFKGNSTYVASQQGLKRPFKFDFDHYDKEQKIHGHSMLNLANDVMDSGHLRQVLAYQIFRDAGVHAPRTAFVQLSLTIPDKHDKKYLGLYTLIEEVNKGFLKRHFDTKEGLLLKPERLPGLQYLGPDWNAYVSRYQPKTDAKPKQTRRLIDFTHLIDRGTDEAFRKEIASYLEVDEFLRFLAVNVLVTNLDSFMGLGHNYYLYVHPKTGKIHFIPWDLDLSFGGFMMGGAANEQAKLSIKEPYMGRNRLIERLFAMPEHREAYNKHLSKLLETAFKPEKIHADIDALNKVLAKAVAQEPRQGGGFPGGFGPPGRGSGLKPFVTQRTESVLAQLQGKEEGVKPKSPFQGGPGGGPRPGGRGFGPGTFLAKPLLEAADTNKDSKATEEEAIAAAKKLFKEADANKDGKLDERELADAINLLTPPPPGAAAPPPPQPGAGPGRGFGPGMFLSKPLLEAADANKDSKVSEEELTAAAKKLLKEADTNKDGKLEERELVDGINRLMPPPPFPGGGPGPAQPPPGGKPEGGKP